MQLLEPTPKSYPLLVSHWMDWSLKLKCCAFAVASVTLGLSVVYVQQRATSRRKRRKDTCKSFNNKMAAAGEVDCPSNSVSQLVSSMEQLKVAQQPVQSPLLPGDEVELPDRDSANHSPSDFLSGNLHSDSHSEVRINSNKIKSRILLFDWLFRVQMIAVKGVQIVPTLTVIIMLRRVST